MKDVFLASLFHQGVLDGAIWLQSDRVLYRTNKLQVDAFYRRLKLPYDRIRAVGTGRALCFPTVTFTMEDGRAYRFIVFRRKAFLARLDALRK